MKEEHPEELEIQNEAQLQGIEDCATIECDPPKRPVKVYDAAGNLLGCRCE